MARKKETETNTLAGLTLLIEETAKKATDLKKQLDFLEEERSKLLQSEKPKFLEELKSLISQRHYSVEDIAQSLSPPRKDKRHSTKPRERKSPVSKIQYFHPDNPNYTYKRGPFPKAWKDKMRELKLDPDKPEDKEFFKTNHLKRKEQDSSVTVSKADASSASNPSTPEATFE